MDIDVLPRSSIVEREPIRAGTDDRAVLIVKSL